MSWTDDPVRDAERHEAEKDKALKQRPVCCECDHHIQDDVCYEFGDGLICPDCLKDNHKKWTDDYIER